MQLCSKWDPDPDSPREASLLSLDIRHGSSYCCGFYIDHFRNPHPGLRWSSLVGVKRRSEAEPVVLAVVRGSGSSLTSTCDSSTPWEHLGLWSLTSQSPLYGPTSKLLEYFKSKNRAKSENVHYLYILKITNLNFELPVLRMKKWSIGYSFSKWDNSGDLSVLCCVILWDLQNSEAWESRRHADA